MSRVLTTVTLVLTFAMISRAAVPASKRVPHNRPNMEEDSHREGYGVQNVQYYVAGEGGYPGQYGVPHIRPNMEEDRHSEEYGVPNIRPYKEEEESHREEYGEQNIWPYMEEEGHNRGMRTCIEGRQLYKCPGEDQPKTHIYCCKGLGCCQDTPWNTFDV